MSLRPQQEWKGQIEAESTVHQVDPFVLSLHGLVVTLEGFCAVAWLTWGPGWTGEGRLDCQAPQRVKNQSCLKDIK